MVDAEPLYLSPEWFHRYYGFKRDPLYVKSHDSIHLIKRALIYCIAECNYIYDTDYERWLLIKNTNVITLRDYDVVIGRNVWMYYRGKFYQFIKIDGRYHLPLLPYDHVSSNYFDGLKIIFRNNYSDVL